jgi:hypothetical protein
MESSRELGSPSIPLDRHQVLGDGSVLATVSPPTTLPIRNYFSHFRSSSLSTSLTTVCYRGCHLATHGLFSRIAILFASQSLVHFINNPYSTSHIDQGYNSAYARKALHSNFRIEITNLTFNILLQSEVPFLPAGSWWHLILCDGRFLPQGFGCASVSRAGI